MNKWLNILLWIAGAVLFLVVAKWLLSLAGIVIPAVIFTLVVIIVVILILIKIFGGVLK
jgi:hypothetical protein